MSIIRVKTNVLEDYQVSSNSVTPFSPFIVARFPSGPIGQWVKIQNVRELEQVFGNIDYRLPTAYAIKDYVSSFRDTYIYRVAAPTAKKGSATLSFTYEGQTIDILSIETKYETEQLNGAVIQLVKETSLDQIYLKIITTTATARTVGVPYEVKSANAIDFAEAVEKLVAAMNAQQSKFVLTNKFLESAKVESDPVPAFDTEIETSVDDGNSGNTTLSEIDEQKVIDSLQYVQEYETVIDAILAPEFTSTNVIEALSVKAEEGDFMFICSPKIEFLPEETPIATAERFVTLVNSYNPCKSRVVYYPNVFYNAIDSNGVIVDRVEVPASVAMLRTYAINDDLGKWFSPEGISDAKKRGLLTSVVGLRYQVPAEAAEILYNANNPVNYIQSISGIGFIVLGNKVQLPESESKVFSKLHVVRMAKYLHRAYNTIGFEHIGAPIDDFTYENISSQLRILLDKVVAERGLEAYQVKCDRENNTEEMRQDGIIYTATKLKFYNVAEVVESDLIFTNALISNEGGTL